MLKGPLGASATVSIQRQIAGAFTSIVSGTANVVAGNVLRGEVVGGILRLRINEAIVLEGTDAGIASGSAGVVQFLTVGVVADSILDNWRGGDFISAVAPAFPRWASRLGA
jgi:hypothetical protein